MVRFERRVIGFAAALALPPAVIAMALLWTSSIDLSARVALIVALVLLWGAIAYALHAYVIRPLQTIANMAAALREGDFSMRIRGGGTDDALGFAFFELNRLGAALREQRLSALDATALARAVMREIDIAAFVVDDQGLLRLANRAGERLLGQPVERLTGQPAAALGLGAVLSGEPMRTLDAPFATGGTRWQLRRSTFRQAGRPHQLVVLSDLSRALRDEERSAWQRLIRVLGHEINNSLAPIHSIAATLRDQLARPVRDTDWEDDLESGLAVIGGRSASLARFMAAYTRLARLPDPNLAQVDVSDWVRRVTQMETRLRVEVVAGPAVTVRADVDQLDQLLINLVRNAADASLETDGSVCVGWATSESHVDIWVKDEGPGLPDTANLFVPFFTTKPGGSGIGLVLSRQIAEAHGGTLSLINGDGCEARVRLPR